MAWSRRRLLLIAALALGYAVFIAWYHAPYAGSSDASGYLHSARLLLDGKLTTPLRVPADFPTEIPRLSLLPSGFRLDPAQKNLLPSYPVGLPLHFAAFGGVLGLGPASTGIAVISALAFVGLLYLTSREFGVSPTGSATVAALGALSPLTLHLALQPMSDVVAAGWSLAAIYAALRSGRHPVWAATSGVAFAVAVLVRPTSLLLLAPLALALQGRTRHWLAFGLGGLPSALFLAGYNHELYGSFLASSYGDVRSLFSTGYLPGNFLHYLRWIPVVATPLVFAAVALPRVALDWRRRGVLLTWAGVVLIFYGTYRHTGETWWYLRFILPALPALGIAAALGLQSLRFPSWVFVTHYVPAGTAAGHPVAGRTFRVSALALLVAAGLGWNCWWTRELRATQVELDDRGYLLAGRWIAEQLPPEGVLVAYQISGAAYYYTEQPVLSPLEFTATENVRLNAWLTARHRVLYAALYPDEEALVREKMPGQWEVVTRLRQITIWRRTSSPPST